MTMLVGDVSLRMLSGGDICGDAHVEGICDNALRGRGAYLTMLTEGCIFNDAQYWGLFDNALRECMCDNAHRGLNC